MKLCKRCGVIAFKAAKLCALLFVVRLLGAEAGTHVVNSVSLLGERVRYAQRVRV